ncbi:MAG: ABC transporter ATP-binding protein [Candidatus Omnitrophica bacterium]|nr:ABC transporter ATP-binding protein [Candidatus Omnitrophota bacterium]
MENLLEVKNLHTYFYTDQGVSRAVEGASFDIRKAETLGLVGESGCGKTVTALSIMRLVPKPGEIVKGEVAFRGENLLALSDQRMRSIRGRDIGMVFQEPMSSLNPLYTIGYQISEALLAHQRVEKKQLKLKVLQLLERAEIPNPVQRYSDYPHNLSGGLRQRAMIAQGLACNPALLIADEPTTALDVTIQAQILELFSHLKRTTQASILLITHDLGVIAEVADRVCIMYAGRIVEQADVFTIFERPAHPYTQGLLDSIPTRLPYCIPGGQARRTPGQRLSSIPGVVPNPQNKPKGCPFHPRCYKADAGCQVGLPALRDVENKHKVSCFKAK